MPELKGRSQREPDPDEYFATTPDQARCSVVEIERTHLPRWRAEVVLEPTHILEPTCGSGTWLPELRTVYPEARIVGIERNADLAAYAQSRGFSVEQRDILRASLDRYDLIVGNPPFSIADELIPMLLTRLRPQGVLAFLLRLNFLEGQDRFLKLWQIHRPRMVYPLPARPGFTPDGKTDGTGYMMCVWQQGFEGDAIMRHLDNLGLQVRWNGRPATDTRPAILDPLFPDPRQRLVPPIQPIGSLAPIAQQQKLSVF